MKTLLKRMGISERNTVSFGDSSMVLAPGGKAWSVLTVIVLIGLWLLADALEWVDPLFWPRLADVWGQFKTIYSEGYRNATLLEHLGVSVMRVLLGFLLGCLVGIPLGVFVALSRIVNRIFDPIIEAFRPMPPLALIPLVILWFGIDESAKVFLLFLASLWIMALAARSGVLSTNIAKVHCAYTLNANKRQILFRIILPNALPEIFTGMRISMGVCWGTVVAAELVAAESGVGMMIMVASKFLSTDIVVLGVILISMVAYAIDVVMRLLELKMVPWRGKAKN